MYNWKINAMVIFYPGDSNLAEDKIDLILKKGIKSVKGIGEARALLLNKLGIFTVEDILNYFPRDYEDRSSFKNIAQLMDGEKCAFEGSIASKIVESRPRKGLLISKLSIRDETGLIYATWFNQPYIKNVFKPGESYVFYGKITRKRTFEIQNPVYEKISESEMKNTSRIIPVYPSTGKLSQNVIRTTVEAALQMVSGSLEDALPNALRENYNLCDINYAVNKIHFPANSEEFDTARYRLAFEELLLLQLGLLRIKGDLDNSPRGFSFGAAAETEAFAKILPFKLTGAQIKVFKDIETDMESTRIMNRLVQGDVGSGKTILAVLALYKAAKSGFQGAFMVPTEILAQQHYKSVSSLFEAHGIHTALLTGSLSKKVKTEVINAVKAGMIDIVIGTHALLEENVTFNWLGLVVTDEQHRFGVRQRALLSAKGEKPDMLVMTATPIPRTLALIIYGDLDISVLDELPPGRKKIKTYVVDETMRERINNFIRKKVAEGQQVYIVCPLVEESDEVEAKSAVEIADRIAGQDFRDLTVALIHGKMKPADKDEVMQRFVSGEVNILVSTTVIEVGVNVPNATVMVVENAERFGLAQLHQLRGRVGRGEEQSFCILFNEGKNEIAAQRMMIMEKTNDGFVISEKDLELRGPGEFFGTRQHGIPDLKIANLYKDIDILKKAQEAAKNIIAADKNPGADDYRVLTGKAAERFGKQPVDLSI